MCPYEYYMGYTRGYLVYNALNLYLVYRSKKQEYYLEFHHLYFEQSDSVTKNMFLQVGPGVIDKNVESYKLTKSKNTVFYKLIFLSTSVWRNMSQKLYFLHFY